MKKLRQMDVRPGSNIWIIIAPEIRDQREQQKEKSPQNNSRASPIPKCCVFPGSSKKSAKDFGTMALARSRSASSIAPALEKVLDAGF